MIEGSGSRAGSGSIHLTNGTSGSGFGSAALLKSVENTQNMNDMGGAPRKLFYRMIIKTVRSLIKYSFNM